MNCTACGAPMRLEADKECLICDYCGNVYFPQPNDDGVRVLDEPATQVCPVCAISLVHSALSGERLLYCPRCRGMLLSMDALVRAVDNLRGRGDRAAETPHSPDWRDLQRHILCPQCQQEMDTHLYGGGGNIIIDSCSRCELDWLDHGELLRIARAADPHRYE